MKTILLSIVFALIIFSAKAQLITITPTNQMPQIGDTISYIDANTFGFDPDGVGPVTATLWDFATLLNAGTEIDFWYIDATTTSQTALYPNSNLARESFPAAGYEYYETTGTQIRRWGMYDNPTLYMTQNAPAVLFDFPITAGGSYNSSYSGGFAPLGAGEDSVKVEQGQVNVTADRQGTLILPNGTYVDVLRLHVVESFHLKVYFFGAAISDNLIEDDYYYWFHEQTLQPVLIYGITSQDGSPQPAILRYQKSCDYFFPESQEVCEGTSVLWHGQTYTTTGVYYDNYTTTGGCDSIYELSLTVNTNPIVNLGADTIICDNQNITLDAGLGFANYIWSTGGNGQTEIIDSTGTGLGTTFINVLIVDANGCVNSDTISITFDDCTTIDNIFNNQLKIYPNPTNGIVHVDGEFTNVQIFNTLGEKLIETKDNIIDLEQFKGSLFIMKVNESENKIYRRIVVKQ